MLADFAVAVVVAALLYMALVNWLRSGLNNVWSEYRLDQLTLRGFLIVPLLGAALLALFYLARFLLVASSMMSVR